MHDDGDQATGLSTRGDASHREKRALAALDASPFPMILWSAVRDDAGVLIDCRYADCNTAAIEYLRRPRGQIVGRLLSELFHGETAEISLQWASDTLQSGRPLVLQGQTLTSAVTADQRRFDITMTPVNDGVLFMWRDVTQEFNAVEALRASEETLRVVMQNAPVAMNLTAPDGTFMRVNPAMCAFLGRDEETLLRTTWQAITHPDDLADDVALAAQVARGERDAYRLTKRFTWPDGRLVWGDLSVSAVRDEAGVFQYYIAQIVDVTELVRKRDELTESQEHYRLLAENTSDIILRLDGHAVVWVSPSVTEVLGWSRDQVLDDPVERFLDGRTLPDVQRALRAEAELARGQFRVLRSDGTWLWMDASARTTRAAQGQLVTVARLRNVDDETRARAALRDSEERFRTAMHAAPTGMALTDAGGMITQVNPALCRMLRQEEGALTGRHLSTLSDPRDRGMDEQMWRVLRASETESVTREKRLRSGDGSVVWVHNAIAAVRDAHGEVSSYVAQFQDVTRTRQATAALDRLARLDPLTGLPNRRVVLAEVARALHTGEGGRVATLFIDVDRFKGVNDTYGHAAGDALLSAIAQRIAGCIREGDCVGRIGGDEFLVVLTDVDGLDDALRIAARVLDVARAPFDADGTTLQPTISVGLSLNRDADTADSLIARADRALYEAKAAGRNQVTVGR